MKSSVSRILIVALVVCCARPAWTQPTSKPDLEKGIDLVQRGYFEESIEVLKRVVTQLRTEKAEPERRARAYLYLAIAHHGLGQEQTATSLFVEAINTDSDLEVNPDEFPPRIVQFFEEARREAVASGQIRPTEPAPTPEPAAREQPPLRPAPSTSDGTVPSLAASSPMIFKKVDFFQTVGEKEKKFDARLALDPVRKEIVISDEKHGENKITFARIPYHAVTELAYEKSKHRRWKSAIFLTVFAIFSKGKKHWLTIAFEGVESLPANFIYLRLDKRNYRQVLAALEGATGIEPSITIEE